MSKQKIKQEYRDPSTNIALDTIQKGKQAIIFVNTKPSAEKTAEEISKKIKNPENRETLEKLSYNILTALSSPTKQCKRLAEAVKSGIAFHHAGLTYKQKELIEDAFKDGVVKIISATPTLASGIDMPAFRTIIRDLRRYGARGLQPIPVLEFEQMAGRAGRPKWDDRGEAICIASSEGEKESVIVEYINGEVEDIYSKLAVEPVLRTYLLSLIATNVVRTEEQILDFFSETFWAYQFKDMDVLKSKILVMLDLLVKWKFIISKSKEKGEFVSAHELTEGEYIATPIGKRVAELYLDPMTAHDFIKALEKAKKNGANAFGLLQMACNTLEMRPLLRVGIREYDKIQEKYIPLQDKLLEQEPSVYEPEYDTFMDSVKTALMLNEWINEMNEDYLMEEYKVRPGELRAKIEIGNWLLYASYEFCRMLKMQSVLKEIKKLRVRLKNGVREELLALLQLKGIGRVRARKLYSNAIQDIGGVKKADTGMLAQLLGKAIAVDIKEQVGEKVNIEKISERKRKGQMSLGKY